MMYKEDGSEWYNYFHIRQNERGYYFAWLGTRTNAFPEHHFRVEDNMKRWIKDYNWRIVVDNEFEKEVLRGSEEC